MQLFHHNLEKGVVGLISDTHGLLRPQAVDALSNSALIIHAGDMGSPTVIDALRTIAPVAAIRGNVDKDAWASEFPTELIIQLAAIRLCVIHDVKTFSRRPDMGHLDAVIAGHSHRPHLDTRDGLWFINPGSAGPRRFKLPVAIATLFVDGRDINAKVITLDV